MICKDGKKIRLIVEYSDDNSEEMFIREIGNIIYRLPIINSYVIEIDENDLDRLRGISGVKAVHQNTRIAAQMNVARKTVGADAVQNEGFLGRGVTIAILDTGIAPIKDFIHPRNRIIAFKDIVNNKSEGYDDNGHGSHVGGR